MRVIHSARFEISIDGVPRTYRDRKDLALQSAQILKSRNPNSVVKLKDLKTATITECSRWRSSLDWLKFKNPEAPAVKREAEEDWR